MRTLLRSLAVAGILVGSTLATAGTGNAVPIDPSPSHPARTWHPTHCQTFPRPADCPRRTIHRTWHP